MHDPVTDFPTQTMIGQSRARFHDAHRQELPDLIALARNVETVHADDVNAPHGLTQALAAVVADLEAHMRKEEAVVFPALAAGKSAKVDEALNRIAAITHGLRLPFDACDSWRRLYVGLGKLAEDLDEHRYLVDHILFPRFETGQ